MAACPDSSGPNSAPAALAASTYAPTVNGAVVTGWFLPSKEEIELLELSSVGGLVPYPPGDFAPTYWSSSQLGADIGGADGAFFVTVGGHSGPGYGRYTFVKKQTKHVRAVRAF
jgi:hypothetical protein